MSRVFPMVDGQTKKHIEKTHKMLYNKGDIFRTKGVKVMGLIKAAVGAAGGTLADQWKEFFYCEAIDKEVMVVKGQKRTSGRSSNTKGKCTDKCRQV